MAGGGFTRLNCLDQSLINTINEVESTISSCAECSFQGVSKSVIPSVGSPIEEDVEEEAHRLLGVTHEKSPISRVKSTIPVGGNPATPSAPDALLTLELITRRNHRLPVESAIVLHKSPIVHPKSAIPDVETVAPLVVEEPYEPLIITEVGEIIIEELTGARKCKSSSDDG